MTTVDTLLFTQRLPVASDALCRLTSRKVCLGGKGTITALTLLSLGCDVSSFSLTGQNEDYEEVIRRLPSEADKTFLFPWLLRNNRTWIVISEEQQVYTFVDPSPMIEVRTEQVADALTAFLSNVQLVYITAEHVSVLRLAIDALQATAPTVISNLSTALIGDPLDSDGQLLRDLVDRSHTLVMNEIEAPEALRRLGASEWTGIRSTCLREVIVTKGNRGGAFSHYPFVVWGRYEAAKIDVTKCAVGAGDAFSAAYIKARFVEGLDISRSCTYAAGIAALRVAENL